MNKKKAIALSKKVYHHTNSDYETDYSGKIGYKTGFLKPEEQLLLKEANLAPNHFEKLTHNSLLHQFLEIKNAGTLSVEFCSALFIKGLSGDFPRYRQTLMSFWFMNGLSKHDFQAVPSGNSCSICGLPESATEDRTHTLYTYYLGHSWNEQPAHFLAELQEIQNEPKPELSKADIHRFVQLLKEISKAQDDETPGQLEKRIGKLKILPKTDRYKRYGILQTLAVAGILPCKTEFDIQPTRSDIVLPLAGWKGKLGVDFKKAHEIFQFKELLEL